MTEYVYRKCKCGAIFSEAIWRQRGRHFCPKCGTGDKRQMRPYAHDPSDIDVTEVANQIRSLRGLEVEQ